MIWVSRFVGCVSLFLVCSGGAQAQPGGGPPDGFDLEALSQMPLVDGFIRQFNEQCAVCHGEDLFGATLGTPLVGIELRHGDSVPELVESIRDGFPETGMPGWKDVLSETEIYNLALYVAEQRQGTTIEDKRESIPLVLPEGTVQSELHGFRIEQVATGLDPRPAHHISGRDPVRLRHRNAAGL